VISYSGSLAGTFGTRQLDQQQLHGTGITVDYTSTPGFINLIIVGAASKLGFINVISNTSAGLTLNGSSGGVQVAVQDSAANTVAGGGISITLTPVRALSRL